MLHELARKPMAFIELAREPFPELQLHEEFSAARARE